METHRKLATTPINMTVVKIDAGGNMIWQHEYGYQGIDIGFRIIPAPNGGYFIAGRSTTADGDDFYLVKVDDDGLTSAEAQTITGSDKLNVYPNPITDHFFVKSPLKFPKPDFLIQQEEQFLFPLKEVMQAIIPGLKFRNWLPEFICLS